MNYRHEFEWYIERVSWAWLGYNLRKSWLVRNERTNDWTVTCPRYTMNNVGRTVFSPIGKISFFNQLTGFFFFSFFFFFFSPPSLLFIRCFLCGLLTIVSDDATVISLAVFNDASVRPYSLPAQVNNKQRIIRRCVFIVLCCSLFLLLLLPSPFLAQ